MWTEINYGRKGGKEGSFGKGEVSPQDTKQWFLKNAGAECHLFQAQYLSSPHAIM